MGILTSLLLVFSCAEYTDGINDNPNNFTDVSHSLMIPQVGLEVIKASHSNMARTSGMFTDQFTGSDRQYVAYNTYEVTAGDFNDSWTDLYYEGIGQAILAEEKADAVEDVKNSGVAKMLKALLFGEAAALYGDVPFTEAGVAKHPKYDNQKDVLNGVQTILDEAISKVGDLKVKNSSLNKIFVNNEASFKEIANSLKARYYLVAKDYANALKHSKLGIKSDKGDLLSIHSSTSGAGNMMYQFQKQRGGYLTAKGSTLQKLLNGTKPRLLNTPGDSKRATVYLDGDNLNIASGGYYAVDAKAPIISYVETKLIEAEAAVRENQDGLTPFNAVRSYLAKLYEGNFPNSSASGDNLIKEILEERYITLVGSNQVFNDMRRTNNILGIPVKGTGGKLPERFLYSQSEKDANSNFPGLKSIFEKTPVNQ